MVDTMIRRVVQLRRINDHIGGRELRPLVERQLPTTAGLLRHAAHIGLSDGRRSARSRSCR